MELTEILYDVSDHIATITLNRPEKLNAWTQTMEGEYRQALQAAERDSDVRVIIITGAGKGFCAGADMSLLSDVAQGNVDLSARDRNGGDASGNGVRADFQQKYSYPLAIRKPIIAAINGAAAGLGFVHALYCDIRFASETAKLTTAFAQRGLIAEYGLAWMLPRLIGLQNALDLIYSARVITGKDAERIGLVAKAVPAEELMGAVRDYAKQLATYSSPRSMAVIKRMVYEAQFMTLEEACKDALNEMLQSLATDDFREGVASFVEKREPKFPTLNV